MNLKTATIVYLVARARKERALKVEGGTVKAIIYTLNFQANLVESPAETLVLHLDTYQGSFQASLKYLLLKVSTQLTKVKRKKAETLLE